MSDEEIERLRKEVRGLKRRLGEYGGDTEMRFDVWWGYLGPTTEYEMVHATADDILREYPDLRDGIYVEDEWHRIGSEGDEETWSLSEVLGIPPYSYTSRIGDRFNERDGMHIERVV